MSNTIYIEHSLVDNLRRSFVEREPYHFADVGTLFKRDALRSLEREVAEHISNIPAEKNFYASFRKHKLSKMDQMPDKTRAFVSYLNSKEFLSILESITGIPDLQGDPELQGGGIHAIGRGGFLKLHTDFNWHRRLAMHRRLNLLVYLNEGWQDEWLGAIELWNPTATAKLAAFRPTLGTAVLFETSDKSYHGHPDPLQCPQATYRKSIAMYYYTIERPAAEIVFGKSEMTNYVERPGEVFGTDKARRVRHHFQLHIKRVLRSLLKRRAD